MPGGYDSKLGGLSSAYEAYADAIDQQQQQQAPAPGKQTLPQGFEGYDGPAAPGMFPGAFPFDPTAPNAPSIIPPTPIQPEPAPVDPLGGWFPGGSLPLQIPGLIPGMVPVVPQQPYPGQLDDNPDVRPLDYTAMRQDVLNLLKRSRDTYWIFADNPTQAFWTAIRLNLPTADLHTLTQIMIATEACGLQPKIAKLRNVYTHATSFGIKFDGDNPRSIVSNGQWGKDWMQDMVRAEHAEDGADNHDWYRQDVGPGNLGLHLGVRGNGDASDNVHFDPTNPMDHVSTGEPVFSPQGYVAAGDAVYSTTALAAHVKEITTHQASPNGATSKGVLDQTLFRKQQLPKAIHYAELEEMASDQIDAAGSKRATANVRAAIANIDAIDARVRQLSMQDDAVTEPGHAQEKANFDAAVLALWEALAALVRFLRSEVPNASTPPAYEVASDWNTSTIDAAELTITSLQRERSARKF